MRRVPTKMTAVEREFSRQCTSQFPPSTKKHNFHPVSASQMLRCPIGGGSRQNSLINTKNPKGAIYSHFSIHHRDGALYQIKVEGSHNHFLHTSFPNQTTPSDTQSTNSAEAQNPKETAATIRRGQRLRPRLAGRNGADDRIKLSTPEISVEELLFGSDGKAGTQQKEESPSVETEQTATDGHGAQETGESMENPVEGL